MVMERSQDCLGNEICSVSRSVKWVLDVGQNIITILVTDIRHAEVWVLQHYLVYITRAELSANEGSFNVFLSHQVCSLMQVRFDKCYRYVLELASMMLAYLIDRSVI